MRYPARGRFSMYEWLHKISSRPAPFASYTAGILWTDDHISKQMLKYHLDQSTDAASRRLPFIERSVDWMKSRFEISDGTRIADFGCGPGLYATRLAAAGAEVTGIDFSKRSLRYAEKLAKSQGLSIKLENADYLHYASDSVFDLILLIWCDFCALSPDQRSALLKVFRRHLDRNGTVLLDVFTDFAYEKREETAAYGYRLMDGFWAAGDYYGFLHTFKYPRERVVLDKYTLVTPLRIFEVQNWLQYYSRELLRRELAENGFEIEAWYADVAGEDFREDAPEMAVEARKLR